MPSTTTYQIYDFIIVGAGTAACLLTARLSQRLPKHRILVLEAGEHVRDDPKVLTPGLSVSLQSDPTYDWSYVSEPELVLGGRRIKHPRGKLVGGTSAINSHSVVFPNTEWQDRIAEELLGGDEGSWEWSAEAMRDCYARWENRPTHASSGKQDHSTDDTHGVKTSYPRSIDTFRHTGSRRTRN